MGRIARDPGRSRDRKGALRAGLALLCALHVLPPLAAQSTEPPAPAQRPPEQVPQHPVAPEQPQPGASRDPAPPEAPRTAPPAPGAPAEGVPSPDERVPPHEDVSLAPDHPPPSAASPTLPQPTAAAPSGASAAPAPLDAADSSEMVVTAQFLRQNPQKTPLAITAVNAEMLEQRSQVNIAEVANQAPNVRLNAGSGAFGPSLQAYIRGVGQNDFSYALEPGVGVYVDDVYYATLTGSVIDLLDLERIEILRGPQGTLTGQNSIGGAIKLYSRVPEGANTGFLQTTYGRFNRTELRGAADFTLLERRLFGRIAGVAVHKDGYVTRYDYACTHPDTSVPSFQVSDRCKLGTEGGKSYGGARVSLRWLPLDRLQVDVIGDYTKDNSEATPNTLLYVGTAAGRGVPNDPMTMMPAPNAVLGGVPLGAADGSVFISKSPFSRAARDTFRRNGYTNYSTYTDPAPIDGTAPYSVSPVSRVDSGGASAKLKLDLTDHVTLTSISAYRYYEGQWAVEEGTPVNIYLLHNRVWHRQFTEELRLSASLFDDAVDLTLGGFFLTQKSHNGGRINLRTTRFITDDTTPALTLAGFANAEWHILRPLSLVAGLRYTWQEKTFTYGRDAVPGAIMPLSPSLAMLDGVSGKYQGDRLDYRIALQYQWLSGLMTYAQYATGFKGGGVNPRPFFGDQARPHKPETLDAFEVGIKSDFLDKRVRVNLAGFFNLYDDIVMTVTTCPAPSTPTPCFLPINAGKAHVYGGELETVVRPVGALNVDASLSFLHFGYQSISANAASSGITLDMKSPFAPAWQASVGARYDIALGSAGTLAPRLDFSFRDSFFTSPINTPFAKVGARALLNGRLVWTSADELWQAALEVTNITNLLYYYNIRDDRGSSYTVQGQPAPPREWALTLKRSFM